MGAEEVASHQRERLMGAMVETVGRRGYEKATVTEVVALAGVSKTAFYRNFSSKLECFLATYDELLERGTEQIAAAYGSSGEPEKRLRAAFERVAELIAERPAEARLVIVDSVGLGAASVRPRARAAGTFESLIQENLPEAPAGKVSTVTIRAIIGGIRSIIYRSLRDGKPERIGECASELMQWALDYQREAERRAAGAANVGVRLVAALGPAAEDWAASPASVSEGSGLDWEEPANSNRSRSELSQEERIMRATAQVTVEKGYVGLSIAAISAAAGTSNQTFYEHFDSKQAAFLASYEALVLRALERIAAAVAAQDDWLLGTAAGIVTLLGCFVRDPLLRTLAFVERPAAGVAALERAETLLDLFAAFLRPEPLPAGVARQPPDLVIEAIAGGLWAAVEGETMEGRVDSVTGLASELLNIALVPFGVA